VRSRSDVGAPVATGLQRIVATCFAAHDSRRIVATCFAAHAFQRIMTTHSTAHVFQRIMAIESRIGFQRIIFIVYTNST
jgi:hypothetical protein